MLIVKKAELESYLKGKTQYKVTAHSGLNIRRGPSTSYAIVGVLSEGAQVNVIGSENGWAQLDNGNYISAQHIEEV